MAKLPPTKQKRNPRHSVRRRVTALLVVALVVAGGICTWWLTTHHTQKIPKAPAQITQKPQQNQKAPTITVNNSSPSIGSNSIQTADTKMFSIPELGMQLKLPSGLEGIQYLESPDSTKEDLFIYFTTKELTEDKGCRAATAAIGSIARSTVDPRTTPMPTKAYNWKYLDGYYFIQQSPQQPCSTNLEIVNLQSEQIELFKQAFESMGPKQ